MAAGLFQTGAKIFSKIVFSKCQNRPIKWMCANWRFSKKDNSATLRRCKKWFPRTNGDDGKNTRSVPYWKLHKNNIVPQNCAGYFWLKVQNSKRIFIDMLKFKTPKEYLSTC